MIAQTVSVFLPNSRNIRPALRKSLDALNFNGGETPHATGRIPNIVSAPVRPGVAGGFGINAMGATLYERPFDRISKDCLKEAGRFLPIRSTRRNIPVAAFGLKKYFGGTSWVSMHGNNVDSFP